MANSLLSCMREHLDFAGVIFLVLKPDQTVELINNRGCAILGYAKEEIEGRNWFDSFLPPEAKEDSKLEFSKLLAGEVQPGEQYENTVLTREGDIRLIQWHNASLRDDDGRIVGTLSSGQDVSDTKLLQTRLAQQEAEKRKQLISAVLEAQEKERQEIAYELHDNVNQILTSCKLLLEQELQEGKGSTYVSNTYQYIQSAITEIRGLSHQLSPSQLNDLGLEESILDLIERINTFAVINIHLAFRAADEEQFVEPALAISLLRIVQEHLNNIVKHSGADQASITLDLSGTTADLEIRDNGVGFDLKDAKRGLGINNIYNRTEFHSGQAYINTSPGEGCTLSICIPLN
ncbi:MAG TPA: PAS domain S-box protein [Flavisolibacter sp.]|nr:PAS domain S-box protein [Flavisolibacter sp.]